MDLNLTSIGQKEIDKISNKEMNYLVYQLSNQIVNLDKYPRFWSKKAKNKYINKYKDHCYLFRRNILIDNILK